MYHNYCFLVFIFSPYIKPKLGVQCSWGAVVSLGGFLFGFGCTLVGTGLVNTIAPQKAAWALVDTEVCAFHAVIFSLHILCTPYVVMCTTSAGSSISDHLW